MNGSSPTTTFDGTSMASVLELGGRPDTVVSVATVLAVVLHVGMAGAAGVAASRGELVAFGRDVRNAVADRLAQTYDLETVKEPEPPPPEPEPEPEPEKEPPPPPEPVAKEPAREPPPPAAAQAGAVLTQQPDPNDPVDLTGNTFVSGSGTSYAGGTTQAGGTSQKAVYAPQAVATGKPGGTGPSTAPVGPDLSKRASLGGASDWADCARWWPPEADAEQIDEAYVTIQVAVKSDGAPSAVKVLKDPGKGFGQLARRCAMTKRFSAALDREGRAIAAETPPVTVHFTRN